MLSILRGKKPIRRPAMPATDRLARKLYPDMLQNKPSTLSGILALVCFATCGVMGAQVGPSFGFSAKAGITLGVYSGMALYALAVVGLYLKAKRKIARTPPEELTAWGRAWAQDRERRIAEGLKSGAITQAEVAAAEAELAELSKQADTGVLRKVANSLLDNPVTSADEVETRLLAVIASDHPVCWLTLDDVDTILADVRWRPSFEGLLTPAEFEALKARVRAQARLAGL